MPICVLGRRKRWIMRRRVRFGWAICAKEEREQWSG